MAHINFLIIIDVFVIENKNLNSESIFEVQFSEQTGGPWSKELGIQFGPFGVEVTTWAAIHLINHQRR